MDHLRLCIVTGGLGGQNELVDTWPLAIDHKTRDHEERGKPMAQGTASEPEAIDICRPVQRWHPT